MDLLDPRTHRYRERQREQCKPVTAPVPKPEAPDIMVPAFSQFPGELHSVKRYDPAFLAWLDGQLLPTQEYAYAIVKIFANLFEKEGLITPGIAPDREGRGRNSKFLRETLSELRSLHVLMGEPPTVSFSERIRMQRQRQQIALDMNPRMAMTAHRDYVRIESILELDNSPLFTANQRYHLVYADDPCSLFPDAESLLHKVYEKVSSPYADEFSRLHDNFRNSFKPGAITIEKEIRAIEDSEQNELEQKESIVHALDRLEHRTPCEAALLELTRLDLAIDEKAVELFNALPTDSAIESRISQCTLPGGYFIMRATKAYALEGFSHRHGFGTMVAYRRNPDSA
ncbi:hypothetical protein J4464_05155 [Candidatus Woesearchaeota archaeon]|nr:hypothetical protein [Candidatus Woesearchaeota archaeon]